MRELSRTASAGGAEPGTARSHEELTLEEYIEAHKEMTKEEFIHTALCQTCDLLTQGKVTEAHNRARQALLEYANAEKACGVRASAVSAPPSGPQQPNGKCEFDFFGKTCKHGWCSRCDGTNAPCGCFGKPAPADAPHWL